MKRVNLPWFYAHDPALWFAKIEAVFALNKITSESDKYNYVICQMGCVQADIVRHVILKPEYKDKYNELKMAILNHIYTNKLKDQNVGKRMPSEFYKHLRNIADDSVSNKEILKIWLKKLPEEVQGILSVGIDDCNTDALIAMADSIVKLLNSKRRKQTSEDSEMNEILCSLKELDTMVNYI